MIILTTVPLSKDDKPLDQIVNEHIERNCDSELAARKRAKKKEGRYLERLFWDFLTRIFWKFFLKLWSFWKLLCVNKFVLKLRFKRTKLFWTLFRCCAPKCKKKELVPIMCSSCNLSVCLKHRHPTDHDCIFLKNNGLNDDQAMKKAMQVNKTKKGVWTFCKTGRARNFWGKTGRATNFWRKTERATKFWGKTERARQNKKFQDGRPRFSTHP